MTTPDTDIARFQNALRAGDLAQVAAEWTRTALMLDEHHSESARTVVDAALQATAGWLTLTDRVVIADGGTWLSARTGSRDGPNPDGDKPLAGELALDDAKGLAIQHIDGNQWRLLYLGEDEAAGTPCLARNHKFETVLTSRPRYRVRSYWFLDGLGYGYSAMYQRFCGFEHAEEQAE